MFSRMANIFRVPDLRNKVLFTLLVIAIYQFGANVPIPYVSWAKVQSLEAGNHNGILGFLNLFSGGALIRLAVFSLGVMPYITSSIIIQLLTTVIPKLEEWRDQGAVGQKKLTQTTRYLTVALALMQSTGLIYAFHGHDSALLGGTTVDFIPKFNFFIGAFMVLVLTAGTAFVMWLAELITQRGIGQGMSILIFANVVASIPAGGHAILLEAGKFKFAVMVIVSILLLIAIVFVEQGQRRIPVTFAKRVVGRRMYGGSSTYIPLKVNQSGVIPIIFASSVLYIPVLMANVVPWNWFKNFVNNHIVSPTNWVYIISYFVLIVAFTFFYVYVAFDPHQQADLLRKQGGFIPGIRPGPQTERYFNHILKRITVPGALFLATVAVTPSILMHLWNITQFPYYGTTLLIAVGVALETMKQIDSQLMMRNYEGFLK